MMSARLPACITHSVIGQHSLIYALYKQEQWYRQGYGITAEHLVQKDAIQNDTMQKDARQRDDTQNDAMPSTPVGKPNSVCTSVLSKISTLTAEAQRYYMLAHFYLVQCRHSNQLQEGSVLH